MENIKFKQYLEEYKIYIQVKNYKNPQTYCQAVKELLEWAESNSIKSITSLLSSKYLKSYYEYLSQRPNKRLTGVLSDSTVNGHCFALSLFMKDLLEKGIIKTTISLPRRSNQTRKERQPLTKDEVLALYNQCETNQDKAILSIAYGCGLRRDEIKQLNVSDVQLSKGILIVRNGKNNKRREVPMSNQIICDLKEYIIEERHKFLKEVNIYENALFINKKGKRMTGGLLNDTLQKLVVKTQSQELVDKAVSLHSLRHSIATHLAENGAEIEFIKDFLGHSEIDTAHLYAIRRNRNKIFSI